MSKTDPWTHFDEAFRCMDRGFREIDWRAFADVRHTKTDQPSDPLGRRVHTLTARNWRSRRRIAWLFIWLAWRIITRGRATIKL